MQRISAIELRQDLSGICARVQEGENLILRVHGVDAMLLTQVAWARFFEKISQIDKFLESVNPEIQTIFRKILIDALNHYATCLSNMESPLKLNELLWKIGEDLHIILAGEVKKQELNIS